MAEFTEEERNTIRTGAFGAIALVSKADPGFFATFKESMAGSKAFAAAPAEIQGLLKEGGLISPPKGSPAEVEASVVSSLTGAVQILQAKAPEQAQGYRDVVLAACDQVANASKGVAPEETDMINKIRAALG